MTDEPNTDIQATNGQFDSVVVTGEIASDKIRVEEIESERNTVTDQLNVGITTVTNDGIESESFRLHTTPSDNPEFVSSPAKLILKGAGQAYHGNPLNYDSEGTIVIGNKNIMKYYGDEGGFEQLSLDEYSIRINSSVAGIFNDYRMTNNNSRISFMTKNWDGSDDPYERVSIGCTAIKIFEQGLTNQTERARDPEVTVAGNVNIGAHKSINAGAGSTAIFSYLRFGGSQYGAADIRPTDEQSHKIGLSFYTDGTQDTTINPTEKLRIKCTGAIGVGTTAYEGTSGQVLTSLGSTSPTWRHANTPMWHGSPTTNTAAAQVVAGDGNYYTVTALTVDSIDIDKAHGGWNAATGVFTVPTGDAGIYWVYGITAIDDIDGGDWVRCAFSINGAGINHFTEKYLGGDAFNNLITNSGTYSKLVSLSEGDTIEMKVRHSDGSANRKIRGNRTHFGGYRLSA